MKKHHKKVVRQFSWVLFSIYIILMAYFLFFSEYLNRSSMGTAYRYNLIFLKEVKRSFWCLHAGDYSYFVLNFVMNIVAFVPFGFFLPIISTKPRHRRLLYVVFSALQFTLVIEIIQLVLKVGTFDVDDIFLNTLGGLAGVILFKITHLIWKLVRKVL